MKTLSIIAIAMISVSCDKQPVKTDSRTAANSNINPTVATNPKDTNNQPNQAESPPPKKKASINDEIAVLLENYFLTPYSERAKFVVNADEYKAGWKAYYNDSPWPNTVKHTIFSITPRKEENTWVVDRRTDNKDYKTTSLTYIRRQTDGLKVDWSASTGYNQTNYLSFQNQEKDEQFAIFRISAKLADLYVFQYKNAKNTHYSIDLYEQFGEINNRFIGFIEKNSDDGKKLFELVKDGQRHDITL
jgi:hypothetical protein